MAQMLTNKCSDSRLLTPDFGLLTSDFGLPTSNFHHFVLALWV